MLSLNYINPGQASSYYKVVTRSKDETREHHLDYYTRKPGMWRGKTARFLGLKGPVTEEHFERLLNGQSKSGRELVQAGVNGHHRSGYDYTFSAPKSVSIVAELLASKDLKRQLHAAHDKAVHTALTYLEKNYAQARITVEGETRTVDTGNLIYATFTENTSRQQDPQVHTHAVVFNITRRHDGEYRAIMNEPLHNYKMFLGQLYRNELAREVQQLGFAIDRRPKGLFEIKGMPEEVLQEFSTRSGQIEEAMDKLRRRYPAMGDTKLRELAALETRNAKQDLPMSELRRDWQERLSQLNLQPDNLLKRLTAQKSAEMKPANHIDLALEVLTEEESVVTREQLLETGLKLSLGQKTVRELEQELPQAHNLRTVVEKKLFTSREIQRIERDIVRQVKQQRGRHQPLLPSHDLAQLGIQPQSVQLTKDQRVALQFLCSSRDGITGIQGDAGTGKTTMLTLAAEQFRRRGMEVVTLAPTARAVDELRQKRMPNARTIHSLLVAPEDKTNGQARVFIIDEASMLGSRHLGEILKRTGPQDRVILVGDSKQKQSLAAGGIFSKLQGHRVMRSARMAENIRQKEPLTRQVALDLAAKQVTQAFEQLDEKEKIHVVEDNYERLRTAADAYLKLYGQKNTLAIVESNAERRQLNNLIREQLIEQGRLGKGAVSTITHQPNNLPLAERSLSQTYRKGDTFFLTKNVRNLSAGSRGQIVQVDHHDNTVEALVIDKGVTQRTRFDLRQHGHCLNAYTKEPRIFAKGEKIIFLKNDRKLKVENGSTGTLVRMDPRDNKLTIRTDKQQTILLDPQSYPYIDYGYATTNYKVQGLTAEEVLYVADTRINTSYNSLYVAATRGQHGLNIYTNDKEMLRDQVQIEESKSSNLDYDLSPSLELDRSLAPERMR